MIGIAVAHKPRERYLPHSATICFAGAHDPRFTRGAILAAGLKRRGYTVSYCVEPAWGSTSARVAAARRGLRNPGLLWRLGRAYQRVLRTLHARRPRPDVLLLGHPGQLDAIMLRALAPRIPLVLDAFIAIDETLADRGLASAGSPARRLARLVDRLAMRAADLVIVDTAAHLRRYAADYGLDPARAVVVPVGALDPGAWGQPVGEISRAWPVPPSLALPHKGGGDPLFPPPPSSGRGGGDPLFPPPPSTATPTSTRTGPRALRVLYFGGFIPLHGVSVVLEAARRLSPDEGIRIDLVGDGQQAAEAEDFLARTPLPHVHLHRGWMTEEELVERYVTSADVCLGIFAPTPKAMDVVPAKIYLALACGRAVVTGDTLAIREELLARAGGEQPVAVCRPGDADSLVEALRELRDDPELRATVAAAGRRLYEAQFRPEQVVEPLVDAIEGLRQRGRQGAGA